MLAPDAFGRRLCCRSSSTGTSNTPTVCHPAATHRGRTLPCGEYGLVVDGPRVASVERKSLADLVGSLTGGKLRYQIADPAALPRAALVVDYSRSMIVTLAVPPPSHMVCRP
ncbi:ERCC4 domain-containing protein [Mycobacterium heckeshornense]|uniref:ERCC4 domain-containing protein n=1 Tax=Mycobacterium heckeshornense TaxID=110505 RepID=UPI0039946D30